ncbi:hypothetical protein [Geodermatophilus marinus]|uniref:hypothetical protein n=1 Tax=Geodermatophilus sp. LHW52908 TaxID=2303986 RepID=UPI0011C18FB2|nr:hypothetical protein [Geodermatophilus sp. LHW52908]
MLSSHEQRIWDDIERFWASEAEEPVLPGPQPARRRGCDAYDLDDLDDLPAAVVAGVWIAILLIVFGAPAAGLAVGATTALGWMLWRHWPRQGGGDRGSVARFGAEEPWLRRLSRTQRGNPREKGGDDQSRAE